jgi:signal transduction histidine kinase
LDTKNTAEEIKRLRGCLNDLVVVLSLPAIWTDSEPSDIANTLLDVVVRLLRLDFAFVRLDDSFEGPKTEWVRSTLTHDVQPEEIQRSVEAWLRGEATDSKLTLPNGDGGGLMSIAVFRLGLQDEVGRFIVASPRPDFPTQTEQLLLQVAANQAAIGLKEAQHLQQQRHATEELEQRVVERTAELAALNETLKREILDRTRAEELNRALAGRLIQSQEAERIRIARDLHDGVCQELAALAIDMSNLRQKAGDIGRNTQEMLQSLQGRTTSVAGSLRLLSHELHPGVMHHIGLVAALRAHCGEVEDQHYIRVKFSAEGESEPASRQVALSLFRIAQEALRNTVRHGRASQAIVSLVRDDVHLTLTVTDDGDGFDVAAVRSKGLGLVSMEERARLVHAQVFIRSSPGHGTTIEVRVPVDVTHDLHQR